MSSESVATDPTFGGTIADPAALASWFDENVPDGGGSLCIEKVNGGGSNLLFRVRRNGQTYALRRPPTHSNDSTSNNLARELILMTALRHTDVRHARLVAGTTEASVIGAPFEVLLWIDGFTPRDPMADPFASDLSVRRQMGFEVVDALSDVANLDWRAIGLEGFGKPDGFLERQVSRWMAQLDRYRVREIPHLDVLADWLEDNRPVTTRTGLIHGDYSFSNVMFAPQAPARLAAIVDWESATVGDPLIDLGQLLSGWRDPGAETTWAKFTDTRLGFPTRAELAQRYHERTGLPIDNLPYYMALALFKLALIMEGAYARYRAGTSTLASHAAMEAGVPAMIAQAASIASVR